MATEFQYKISQISNFALQKALEKSDELKPIEIQVSKENIPMQITKAKTAIKIPALIDKNIFNTLDAYIFTEEDKEFLYLKFFLPVHKMGYNCSPNGMGQKVKFSQTIEGKSIYDDFIIGKSCVLEYQQEEILVEKEGNFEETYMNVSVYSIKMPLSYLDKKSNIKFVLNYAWNITT